MDRDYESIAREVGESVRDDMDLAARMRLVVDAIWKSLGTGPGGISWAGFYLASDDGREMILGPCRDKPACSPISLHGVCGQALTGRRPVIVADVLKLGADYIACDPRDRSEVVVPLPVGQGRHRAVLDLDSHRVSAFDQSDVEGLLRVLAAAGLV